MYSFLQPGKYSSIMDPMLVCYLSFLKWKSWKNFLGQFQLRGPPPPLPHPFFFKERPRSQNRERILICFWDVMICIASGEYVPNHIINCELKPFFFLLRTSALTTCGVISDYETDSRTPHAWFQLTCFLGWEKEPLFSILNLLNLSLLSCKECYDLIHQWCNHFMWGNF